MVERLYVRVAKRRHMHGNSRYKIDAGPSHNPRPLQVGDLLLNTIHFAIDVSMPDHVFNSPAMPVVRLEVEPGSGYVVEPVLAQVEVAPPGEPEPGFDSAGGVA